MAFEWSPSTTERRLDYGRVLGPGRSSWVQEVFDKKDGKTRALKVIRVTADRIDLKAPDVQTEVTIMQILSGHPHIVEVLDAWKGTDRFSILLSPVADCDLANYFGKCASEGFPDSMMRPVTMWFSCLVEGLAHIHSLRIRHKDIKPANILVKAGTVLFADFGIAKDFVSLGENSTTEGPTQKTLIYAAPEAVTGGKRKYSADVYSLGCVFAEMATLLSRRTVAAFSDFRTIPYGESSTRAFCRTQGLAFEWLDLSNPAVCHLVKWMLQARPEDRPKLDEIRNYIASIPFELDPCPHTYPEESEAGMAKEAPQEVLKAYEDWALNEQHQDYYSGFLHSDGWKDHEWIDWAAE